MSTAVTSQIVTTSSEETEALAERLASNLRGGEVIELVSDLGGGKTTFVRGLTRGLGSSDHVTSPTFTISNTYHIPFVKGSTSHIEKLAHYDFYRLQDNVGLIRHELQELLADENSVIVVEWGEVVKDVLPKKRLTITIKSKSENNRQVNISYPAELQYVLENVC